MTTFTASLVIALVAVVVLCLAGLFEVACMYTDAAKDSAAKDDKIADLEDALDELTERMSDARIVMPLRPVPVTERPDLSIVPPQRTGEHDDLPVAAEPTPIHDRALIDAWIEDVQAWGEDA